MSVCNERHASYSTPSDFQNDSFFYYESSNIFYIEILLSFDLNILTMKNEIPKLCIFIEYLEFNEFETVCEASNLKTKEFFE